MATIAQLGWNFCTLYALPPCDVKNLTFKSILSVLSHAEECSRFFCKETRGEIDTGTHAIEVKCGSHLNWSL